MGSRLIIVESPTKAKTIAKFLGKDYVIKSSNGHVRDLPKSTLGVDVEHDYTPSYTIPTKSKKHVAELRKAAKDADVIYFATDEDREGEAISWHLKELLKTKAEMKRITFHEITKTAIQEALENPRAIDLNLVDAQQARRILDRLFGYELSPLLWKKIAYGLSAGRVQSVSVDLIVEREIERMRFKAANYWDIVADLAKEKENFSATLHSIKGQRIAEGKDFADESGKLKDGSEAIVVSEKDARALIKNLEKEKWTVQDVQEKPQSANPSPPFITSSLQQVANGKLGLSARDTMRTAQRLYEEGLITYMRTDSPNLSQQGISGAREAVEEHFGKDYLSETSRQYKAKAKGAQEAHEAIRPAGAKFQTPEESGLRGAELALYDLIWKRTLATQMAEAKKLIVSVQIAAGDTIFNATGTTILFPGFLKVYTKGGEKSDGLQESILPKLAKGDELRVNELKAEDHNTKPPARFTDASLVKELEKNGVGRPSTYASIISTIIDRNYVRRVGNALVPTYTAFAVTQLLKKHFASLVDVNFTSRMEQSLDDIAEGELEWRPFIKNFYIGDERFHAHIEEQEEKIDPDQSRTFTLPHLPSVDIHVGRFGPYIVQPGENGEEDIHASIPEDLAPADLSKEQVADLIEIQKNGPEPIGTHPENGEKIYVLTGRYGPYLQLGEKTEENPKPRRASVPKGKALHEISMDDAVKYLSLPKVLGQHPDTKKDVSANIGRFGPYIVHDGDFRSLTKDDDVYTVKLERALELLAQEKKGRRGAKELKVLGNHPKDKKPVTLFEGKYGPYIKHGRTNASLPKDIEVDSLDLEKALELLAEKKKK